MDYIEAQRQGKHWLKHSSSFSLVYMRSAMHGACMFCGQKFTSSDPLEESAQHWRQELERSGFYRTTPPEQLKLF